MMHSPHFLFRLLHESKHPTPSGKQVKQVVPHFRVEETYPHVAPGEGVDDIGNEGGKVETKLLKVTHHSVGLTLKVVPGGGGRKGGGRQRGRGRGRGRERERRDL